MKDQLMNINIGDEIVRAYHKSNYVVLTDVWSAGNAYRLKEGMKMAQQAKFLSLNSTKEFIAICEREEGRDAIKVEGKGRNSKTFACLPLAIYAAQYLSKEFHYKTIKVLIDSGIFFHRDQGGEQFKAVNILISSLEDRKGKSSSKGCYIYLANKLKNHINPELESWNDATAEENAERARIEEDICKAIKWGFIRNYKDDLKAFIDKNL